jgi:hypothetical protein
LGDSDQQLRCPSCSMIGPGAHWRSRGARIGWRDGSRRRSSISMSAATTLIEPTGRVVLSTGRTPIGAPG